MKLRKMSTYGSLYFVLDTVGVDCLYKGKLNRMYILHRQRIGYHECVVFINVSKQFYI